MHNIEDATTALGLHRRFALEYTTLLSYAAREVYAIFAGQ